MSGRERELARHDQQFSALLKQEKKVGLLAPQTAADRLFCFHLTWRFVFT